MSQRMDLTKHVKPLSCEAEWPLWKRKIRDLLDYHEGALDVIDGKLEKPADLATDAKEDEVKKHKEDSTMFRKANSYAKSMIASTVTDSVYQKIMDAETAKEAWEALKKEFEVTSKDQIYNTCIGFFEFSWNKTEDVSTHIAKLKTLWNELNNGLREKNENPLPDLLLVCKSMHILPSTFDTFKSGWRLLTKDDDKTFDELTTQLLIFERDLKKNENDDKFSQEALVVNSDKKKAGRVKKGTGKNDKCNYCKLKGHWVKDCKKWIADGRPPKRKTEDGAQTNPLDVNVALISVSNEVYKLEANSTDWWIDNGATRHVTNHPEYFADYRPFKTSHSIMAAGKETLKALGEGTIEVLSKLDDKIQKLTLTNVWYVPKISKNLFSVLAAQDTKANSKFESTVTSCSLEVDGKRVLCGVREEKGTLYKALIDPITPQHEVEINVAEGESSLLQLYHERWGHQDKQHVRKMLERQQGVKVKLQREICEPCIFGKAHRLPFGTREKTEKPGELISGDVCGPFSESFNKKRYLVVFKDSFTKFRYGYIVKEKSEVKTVLKHMIEHAKSQGHSLKEFLSDNGGEFDNEEVRKTLHEQGITQRLTAPYTPEQNGGTERENRTIVEMARTFKYSNSDVELPAAIWAELVSTAVYILNRTGKSSVEGTSPYELWMKKKPRVSHLRIVGSTCYIHVPAQKRRKMDVKAVKGYLVGYDGDERYRVYLPDQHKVVISRDVIFNETPRDCRKRVPAPLRDVEPENKEEEELEEPSPAQDEEEKNEELNEEESEMVPESEAEEESHQESERSLRDRLTLKKPTRFWDYIMTAEEFLSEIEVPETFENALGSKQSAEWRNAMDREMASLRENHTWEKQALPDGAKAIPCKWVFRVKTNPDGTVDKFKARLVIKGYSQRQGVDYNQTFSPVARMSTVRSVLSIVASEKMNLAQFDVSTAFLYGKLEERIFMRQPEGYEDGTDAVCELKKSLYGLKQAPRCWNQRFGRFLESKGFKVSEADPCLYTREKNEKKLILVLYVDDGLVAATHSQDQQEFLEELKAEFKIVSKTANYFLGIEIERGQNSLKIHQEAYAKRLLERFNFSCCKPVTTPMLKTPETKEINPESRKENVKSDNFPYRQAVGAVMYLMQCTRPDLAYSVGFLSRSLENPSSEDVIRIKRVLRYISGTINQGIMYQCNPRKRILECYSDADYGGCTNTGRSTTGIVIIHAGGAISWLSQRQAMVATSTTEAEIVAANEGSKEIIWLKRLFEGILSLKEVPILQVDNSAAVRLAQNPEFHRRTKHIAMKHFFIRERVLAGDLAVQQIPTEVQIADIMTKPLPGTRLRTLCNKMGLK